MDSSQNLKNELRAAAFARRDALDASQRAAACEALAKHAAQFEVGPGCVVAGFSAIRTEIDPSALMWALRARGASLALPVALGRGEPLIFRAWRSDTVLVRGLYGILEPSSDAEEVEPDIVLVPLAAFDRRGHRLGYGGGYYDRTLQRLRKAKRITAAGLAFSAQQMDEIPVDTHDEPLDLVLTERDVINFRE
ncbi:5-formyltetrahydrofolate cyclo-ligase [[Pseudomonas] carboxydohydrogena]|uniref:5-formyltetrahydrofolate cyclo-ligase n=1 Tax=Afipia carboxydohydrogena TaxID=290 RepID=A0ABY8BPG8_AFICR|nr:5-formyltetrahydrofolate cyclo-ligase [[Pseudomonas] carboxydohydrogena]WEF51256.1 5-formyltetrahydrofolate cyclo-ligase [[Pseudomonas] carboxydohydrogena]